MMDDEHEEEVGGRERQGVITRLLKRSEKETSEGVETIAEGEELTKKRSEKEDGGR